MDFLMQANVMMVVQFIIGTALVVLIMLQQRGEGLSSTFGGQGGFYGSRRGVEKAVFNTTIILTILFLATALLTLYI